MHTPKWRMCARLGWLLILAGLVSDRASAFNADLYTSGTNRYLWLDNLITAAPIGTKLWVVADLDGNGVNTNVTANGLIQGDDFLLFERFVDGTLFGSQTGRFREFGMSVDDLFLSANIYIYLWNTNTTDENGGDQFGILNLGVIAPPTVGNAQWIISSNITANTYTLRGFTTNIWNAPNSGSWSDGANWGSAPAIGGTSDTLLVFGGAGDYSSTNDLAGNFLMNVLSFNNSGNVNLSGNALRFTNEYGVPLIQMNGSGTATVANDVVAASDLRLEGAGSGLAVLSGVISGSGDLTKIGGATFVLSNANTYSGTSVIAGGTLLLGHDSALSTNQVTFTNGVLAAADATARTIGNALRIGDVTFGQDSGGTGDLVFTGPVDLTNPLGQRTIQIDNSLTEFRGAVGNGGLIKTGAGTLLLTGTNTFTNGIYITDGTVRAGSPGALNPADPAGVSLDAGALEIHGTAVTIGRFNGFGGVVRNGSSTNSTLTIDSPFDDVYFGSVADGGSGTLRLVKTGSGTQTFEADNSFSGGTEIRAGSIQLNTLNGLGTGGITLGQAQLILRSENDSTFGPGAGYAVTLTNSATVNLGNLSGDPFNIERTLSVGPLTLGTNSVTIVSPNAYFLAVNGPVGFTNATVTTAGGGLIVRSNASLVGINTFSGNERIRLAGPTNTLGTNATLVVTTSRGMTVSNLVLLNGTNQFNVSSRLGLDALVTNGAAPARLVKTGGGELTLTNFHNNGYSGGTEINSGTLFVAAGTNIAAGTFITLPLGTGPVTLNGGTLIFRSDSAVTNGPGFGYNLVVISNATVGVERFATNTSQTLSVNSLAWGTNLLTVTGANNYTLRVSTSSGLTNTRAHLAAAGVTLNYRSNLFLFGATNLFTGLGNFSVSGTTTNGTNTLLRFESSGTATFGSVRANGTNVYDVTGTVNLGGVSEGITGTRLVKTGSGILTFTANSSFTGGVEAQSGTLQANSATALGTGTNILLGAATLNLRNNSSLLFGPGSGYTVTLTNDATIDVRRASGTTNGNVLTLSNIVFNGRQLTVTGANAYSLALNATNWSNINLVASSANVLFTNSSSLAGTNRFAGTSSVQFLRTNTFGDGSILNSSVSGGLIVSNPVLNGTLTVTNTANVLLNGVIADGASAGSILKRGNGTLLITNLVDNTFTGGIDLLQGNLQVAGGSGITTPLGTGPVNLSGGTLQLRADTSTTFGPAAGYTFNLLSNSTINVDRLNTPTVSNVLSIGGITGPGALTVNSGNGYTLAFNNNAIWSNSTITATTLIQYNGTVDVFATNRVVGLVQSIGGFVLQGPVTLSNATALSLFGPVADGAEPGQLHKIGAGTLALTNLQNQSYSGGTVLGAGNLTVAGGTNAATSQFVTNPLGTGPVILRAGTLNLRSDTNLTWGGAAGYDILVQSNATISLAPFSANPNSITNREFRLGSLSNFANLTLSQSSNFSARFLGPAAFSNSILTANATGVFAGPVTIAGITRFAGNRDIFIDGALDEAAPGAVLEKDGSARLYLTNLNNRAYTGGTVVRNGQLRVHSASGITQPLGTGAITMYGGTLELRDTASRNLGNNLLVAGTNANAVVDVRRPSGTAQNQVLTLGSLTLTNGGSLQVNGADNYVLRFSGGLTLGSQTNVINVNNGRNTQAYSLEIQGALTETVAGARLVKSGGAQEMGYTSTAMPTHSGGTFIQAGSGALTWRPSGLAGGTYGFGTGDIFLNSGVFRFQNSVANNYVFTNNYVLGNSVSVSSGRAFLGGGTLDFTGQGASPRTTNTGSISLGGPLTVTVGTGGGYGTNRYALAFAGPMTLVGDNQTLVVGGSGGGVDDRVVFFGNVGSDNGQRALTVAANNGAKVELAGTNGGLGGLHVARGYAGAAGVVLLADTNALPAGGRVSVAAGAAISVAQQHFLTGANTNFASLTNWFDLAAGSVVQLHSTNRAGFSQNYNGLLDFSATGLNRDVRLGALEGYTITVTNSVIPYATTYKLGAGQGALVLNRTNQLTGANRLEVGVDPGYDAGWVTANPVLGGTLRLQQSNDFSGGTLIHQGATAGVRGTNVLGTGDVEVYGLLSLEVQGILQPVANGLTNRNRLILHPTAELRLENNEAVNTNRVGDTEFLVLNGALLRSLGRGTVSTNTYEYISNVTTLAGSRIQYESRSTGTNVVQLGELVRGLGFTGITNGTIQLVPAGTGLMGPTNRLLLDNAASLVTGTNGMLAPWIVNQTTGDYVSVSNNTTVVGGYALGLTNFTAYRPLAGAGTGEVVSLTGVANNLTTDTTLHALRLAANSRLTNNGGANNRSLTLLSGGLLGAGNATNDAHLLFRDGDGNPVEALIYANGTLRLTGTNDAARITKFGDGNLQIGTANPAYTNGWNVNRGTLEANLATGAVAPGGTNFAFGNGGASNYINLNGNATLRLSTTATNQTYASGKITSWDNNAIVSGHGAQDGNRVFFAPAGIDLRSISNGPLGSQLRVDLERTRSELHLLGALALHSDAILNVRDTGGANVNTGSTNRLILAGGLAATNRVLIKYGNGVLELPGDNTATALGNTLRVTGGALSVGHNGALGDAGSTLTVGTNAVLELNAGLVNFQPVATVTQMEGSAERWLGQYNRFTDDATPQTYAVPTNVTLQLAGRLYTNANHAVKTLRLQGGGLESYQFTGDGRNANNTNVFNVEFTGNLRLGQSGIDAGRATTVAAFNGNFTEVNPGLTLTKVGVDTIILNGTAAHTGGTFVNGGLLRLSRAAADNATLLTDGVAGNTDVTINSGILELAASEQIADNAGVVLNTNGTLRFNGSGRIETLGTFRNTGGTFVSGANTLDLTGSTVEWLGGANTISTGGAVKDKHWIVTGGQNIVEGGGLLEVKAGGGTAGLYFGGTGSPAITVNSAAGTPGRIELNQDVTVSNTVAGAAILNGGTEVNAGVLDLMGGVRTFTVEDGTATNDLTLGVELQNGGFIKAGDGRLTMTRASTLTGTAAVTGGTLELTSDGALGGAGQIQISTGGTLLLSGSPANRINDLAGMNLAGGTFNSGGLAESLGALTLSSSSTIDLGSGASTVSFTSGTRSAGTLTIDNWSGSLAGGGTDQLRFDTALDSTFLANINFTGFDPGALQISFGSYVEIVPVPEPATVLGSLALASLALWRERRRIGRLFKR